MNLILALLPYMSNDESKLWTKPNLKAMQLLGWDTIYRNPAFNPKRNAKSKKIN